MAHRMRSGRAGDVREVGRENKHGLVSAGKWKREIKKGTEKRKSKRKEKNKQIKKKKQTTKIKKVERKKERKEVEIRGTNMALLVAVAETSAEETTPHLEHLSVMP